LNHALVLVKMYDFKEGILFLYEKSKLYREVIQHYMDNDEYASVLSYCKKYRFVLTHPKKITRGRREGEEGEKERKGKERNHIPNQTHLKVKMTILCGCTPYLILPRKIPTGKKK